MISGVVQSVTRRLPLNESFDGGSDVHVIQILGYYLEPHNPCSISIASVRECEQ